jgi:hypothetical protein
LGDAGPVNGPDNLPGGCGKNLFGFSWFIEKLIEVLHDLAGSRIIQLNHEMASSLIGPRRPTKIENRRAGE